ncbi:MAG: glycoside hydrolase family 65 protein [Geminicoccaceae bacterium]|nr:MAG: glycoside hydrolase family 65 protein [Geminicoccaceae bacterium]
MTRNRQDWRLVYEGYAPEQEGLREALCTLGNGYFATRGAAPDRDADDHHYPGTYLAGGYNRLVSEVEGRKIENEDLVNLPNWLCLTCRIDDGPWLRLGEAEVLDYRQELDVEAGVLHRSLRLRDDAGRVIRWRERRLVSMADAHLAAMEVALTAENWSGRLTVRSAIDASVVNDGVARYRGLANRHFEVLDLESAGEEVLLSRVRTMQSRLEVVQATRTRLEVEGPTTASTPRAVIEQQGIFRDCSADVGTGQTVTVEKVAVLYTSRDVAIAEPRLAALAALERAAGFETLREAHARAWAELWEDGDIVLVDADGSDTELKLRVHIFHLLQTVSPHSVDLDVGAPARGWHGEAYRGHIFWDELFIFPFLNLRFPMLTRALLRYRYRRLDAARRAAKAEGFAGAMFPWQSGSDGREETQKLHLNPKSGRWNPDNTHRQRHINLAIAYNVWQYHQATDDHEFMWFYGAEMMLEIARFWASVTTYDASIDRYRIRGVMGPDEYHTAYPDADPEEGGGLDDNAYTNVMAAWVLNRACDVLELLPADHARQLLHRLGMHERDVAHWQEIARKLRVPFHDGIISQFEGYGDLEELDWEAYRRKYGDIHRLDRILEAEGDSPNRYKVSKQADVLMLFYLLSADELALLFEQLGYPFERDTIPKTIDYYMARTSDGSTLSALAHAWVLARADRPKSWHLFQRALDSDIADIQGGTTPEGIHAGAMAGTIDLVQRCYLGIEIRAGVLAFDPALADDLHCVRVRLHYRHQVLDVEVDHDTLTIQSGAFAAHTITVAYRNRFRDLAPGQRCRFRLLKPEERNRDENPSITSH